MNKSKNNIAGIYVELDCLLDTRLGTLAKIDDAAATAALAHGYHEREIDDFQGVNMERYRELYQNRDVETLKRSSVTEGIRFIRNLVGQLVQDVALRPYVTEVSLTVNYYPYQLSEQEQADLLSVIRHWTLDLAPVQLVSMSPEHLTPKFVQQHYSALMIYDYDPWMSMHVEGFETTRLHDVMLFAPRLYYVKKPSEQELKDLQSTATHPFQATEMLASPLVGLQLIDIKYFSLIMV